MKLFSQAVFENGMNIAHGCVAIVDKNATRQTTWKEFHAMARSVAIYAQSLNLQGVIPVCMDRSAETAATLLGLNLAGLSVAPIALDTPQARLRSIEEQTRNKMWTEKNFLRAISASNGKGHTALRSLPQDAEEPSYVVFTSGSTGTPKGVVLSNTVVTQSIKRLASKGFFDCQRGENVLQIASFSFIATMGDLFAPLYAGCTVHILPNEARKDIELLAAYINEHDIKTTFAPPQLLARLGDVPSLRHVATGSDTVSNLGPKNYELVNLYGSSETGGPATSFNVDRPYEQTPIGSFSDEFEYYLVDDDGNLADEGEICISGAIASGYLNMPEQTAEIFTPNPFSDQVGHETLFHTKDIGQRREDGNLYFLGRKDFMIKINGQRVEPGESQAALRQISGIKNAAVRGFSNQGARSYLCAYYVADKEFDSAYLRKKLEATVPAYMIPSYFVRLPEIPLNANGKVAYKQLEPPVKAAAQNPAQKLAQNPAQVSSPSTEEEALVCEAFAKVLGLASVSPDDDFLVLGGDSLTAMDVSAELVALGIKAKDILSKRTPRALLALSAKATEANATSEQPQNTNIYADLPQGEARVELTDSQLGIYLPCSLKPDVPLYNIPFAVTLPRESYMTKEVVQNAINELLCAHPALLARVEAQEDACYMVRQAMPENGIAVVEEANEARFRELCEAPIQPFNLAQGPLVRAHAVLTGENVHVLFDTHHMVSDGSSVAILVKQLTSMLYEGQKPRETVDAFSLHEIEKRILTDEVNKENESYFSNLLAGVEIDSNLVADYTPEQTDDASACTRAEFALNLPDFSQLLRSCRITEGNAFMGAFAYTLAKMTGQEDAIFCAASSGRHDACVNDVVGMMVRTLPIVVHIDETQPIQTYLREVQDQAFNTFAHDSVSFGALCHEYGISSDILFVYQGEMFNGEELTCGHVSCHMLPSAAAISNLSLQVHKVSSLSGNSSYRVLVEYRSDLYCAATIERLVRVFENTLQAIVQNKNLADVSLLSLADMAKLDSWNQNTSAYDASKTVLDKFRARVKDCPNNICVVYKDKQYTYAQVDEISTSIAVYLHEQGIGFEDVVPVLISRSEYMVIASLGVMKAGAMYEPLDPSYPSERLSFMCEDASARIIIADASLTPLLPNFEGKVLLTSKIPSLPVAKLKDKMALSSASPKPKNGCVLLYTSGTTGKPKGCIIAHSNVYAFVHAYKKFVGIGEGCVSSAYASFGFDAHLADIYPALTEGGTVHIIPQEMRLDLPAIYEYATEANFTHMLITTQVGRQFAMDFPKLDSLRCLSVGGETLVPFEPECNYRLVNAYGPSECTVASNAFVIDKLYANVPIGAALPNTHIYVVDAQGRRVPVGVPGELIVCGPQVGQGYLNREEKTREVFVANTFEPNVKPPYDRCYRTGDVVRLLEGGIVEFIGRRDSQVKIRGFRIELTEVERVIRDYPGIKDATVVARDDATGKCIHAYIVADTVIDVSDLARFIREVKPPYMVPAATMQIEAIPYTPNMKVDKRKLPPISAGAAAGAQAAEATGNATRNLTALERKLVELVAEVLNVPDVDIATDLIFVGLTSVTSIKLSVKLYNKYGLRISSSDLLNGCTILSLEDAVVAQLLAGGAPVAAVAPQAVSESASKDNTQSDVTRQEVTQLEVMRQDTPIQTSYEESYPLTQIQMGIYLECLRSGTATYNIPLMLKLPQNIDTERLKQAVVAAIKAHPSMLVHIYANETGDVAQYPVPNMPLDIAEVTCAAVALPLAPTHFEFEPAPLFCVRLIHCADTNERFLFLEAHHIISDGTSMGILLEDIERAYNGGALESEIYTAFSLSSDEQTARVSDALALAKEAYAGIFQGVADDYKPCADRASGTKHGLKDCATSLDASAVDAYCKNANVTENAFFTGVFAYTLSRFTAHEDALFATIHNGRTDPRCARMASMLVRTLPLYVAIDNKANPASMLQNITSELATLKRHEAYSFADAARDFGVNADVMFIYQGVIMQMAPFGGEVLEETVYEDEAPKAQLCVEVFKEANGYRLQFDYNAGLYSDAFIESFADAFATVAKNLMAAKELGQIELCSSEALAQFDAFNNTAVYVPYRPAYRLLEDSAVLHPERLAVVAGEERLTYKQLDCMANHLAHTLLDAGIKPGSVVEVIAPRIAGVYVAQNGIMKAGSAFLFLSPAYPDERISFVTQDSSAAAVVTTRALFEERSGLFGSISCPVFFIDDIPVDVVATSPSLEITPDEPAYLIYTSGTTGKPKGIIVRHRGIINLVHKNLVNEQVCVYTHESTVAAAVAAFTFDASVFEEFFALAHAMTLVMAQDEEIHNPVSFTELCLREGITSMTVTPPFLMANLDYAPFAEVVKQAKCILMGGEVVPATLYTNLRDINPELSIINSYGPSETTVSCSSKLLKSADGITIGKPIANTKIYMIDNECHILPKGALGEMVVLGDGVGLGYLNRPDRTAHAFIEMQGLPAYRTGDLAIITHDDEIEFHGRMDNQVKLRGLRVELGEIENAIEACDDVKKAIVLAKGDERNRFLVAYFTAARELEAQDIIAQISRTLAEYMVPRVFMQLDEMPLTVNGKIDRRALPEPKLEAQTQEYVEPATQTERTLCAAFEEILGLDRVGATDDFFMLGGTSITASKLVMNAMSHGIEIVYGDVFEHPTPRGLSALATGEEVAEANASAQAPALHTPAAQTSDSAQVSDIISIPRALENNVSGFDDDPGFRALGNVLLTGATGFLGMHVLNQLLNGSNGDIYCFMRAGAFDSLEIKLQSMYMYYFEKDLSNLIGSRIHFIEGDITNAEEVHALASIPFNTLINCAACVKHFSNDDTLEKVNVRGVEHLVELCLEKQARLIHVSTVSVAGEATQNAPADGHILHENELYFGQLLENRYIETKFESECVVLSAVSRGLDAKVMRVGNLMPRYTDGEFQINSLTNGFMRQLRGYFALGCVPYAALAMEFEFSPIDETAASILALAQTDSRFTVFHANNTHRVFLADVIRIMNEMGMNIEPVDGATFKTRLQAALADTQSNDIVAGLIAYLGHNQTQHTLGYENDFTRIVLNRLGFYWHIPDDEYMRTAFEALRGMGFFDLELGL